MATTNPYPSQLMSTI